MREHTHNNHFRWGYDKKRYLCFRNSPEERFHIDWSPCEREHRGFREECIEAAKLIYEKADLELNLLFTGGKDSQVAARAFMAAKVPFRAFICRYENGINMYDIQKGIDFCEAYGIPYELLDLNVMKFFEQEAWDYSERYGNSVPMGAVYLWICDQMDGHPIMSNFRWWFHHNWTSISDLHYFNIDNPQKENPWVLMTGEQKFALCRYFMVEDREGTFDFLIYTPELALSFLEDYWTQKMIQTTNPPPMTDYRYASAVKFYMEHCYMPFKNHTFYEAFSIPAYESTYGYDGNMEVIHDLRARLKAAIPYRQWQADEYFTLKRQLTEKIRPDV